MRRVFQRELFHKGSLKENISIGAAVASIVAGVPFGLAIGDKLVENYQAKNNVVTVEAESPNVISPEEREVISQLREIVSHMDLSPEEIDRLCNEEGFPREIFEPVTTVNIDDAMTK